MDKQIVIENETYNIITIDYINDMYICVDNLKKRASILLLR